MIATSHPRDVLSFPSSANDEIATFPAELYAQHESHHWPFHQMLRHVVGHQDGLKRQKETKSCTIPQTIDMPQDLKLANMPYPFELYFLSSLASYLRLEIPRRSIERIGYTFHDAFTGKELILILCRHIRRYLPIQVPGIDRKYALAIARNLQSQHTFIRLDGQRETYVHESIQDDGECILSFVKQEIGEETSTASGVFTPMLYCYSPACDGISSRTCYSPTCPRRPRNRNSLQVVNNTGSRKASALLQVVKAEKDLIHNLSVIEFHVIDIIRSASPISFGTAVDAQKLIVEIFFNISDIKKVHQWLLNSLLTRLQESSEATVEVGDIFMVAFKHGSPSYPMYLENLPRALKRLQQEQVRNPEFGRIIRRISNAKTYLYLAEVHSRPFLSCQFKHLQDYPRKLEDLLLHSGVDPESSNAITLTQSIESVKSILSVSRLLKFESEMVWRDTSQKYATFLPDHLGDLADDIFDTPGEQSEVLASSLMVLSGIDISSRLVKFEKQIDTRLMGGFGIIRKGLLQDETAVAIKTLKVQYFDGINFKRSKRFWQEMQIWRNLTHKNVLPFLGVVEVQRLGVPMSLTSPWMKNGNSLEFCSSHPNVPRIPIIRGVTEGLSYLHSRNVVHGDIKAPNILISDFGTPYICDFGLAYVSSEGQPEQSMSTTVRRAGSWRHMAIELHESESPGLHVTRESDMWAFGMLCIEIRYILNTSRLDILNYSTVADWVPSVSRSKRKHGCVEHYVWEAAGKAQRGRVSRSSLGFYSPLLGESPSYAPKCAPCYRSIPVKLNPSNYFCARRKRPSGFKTFN